MRLELTKGGSIAEPPAKPNINNINMKTLLKQYRAMKKNHPDAILLFRVGDGYEMFLDDAVLVSKITGLTLTARLHNGRNIDLVGFPHWRLDYYLPKLVRAGNRVAICEQLVDPKPTVKRGIPA